MKIMDLFESSQSLSNIVASMNSLPTRLRIFVDTNYRNRNEFLQAVRQFEISNPAKSRQIIASGKYQLLIVHLQDIDTGLDTVRTSQLNIRVVDIDESGSVLQNRIILSDNTAPKYLFRYVSGQELKQIENDGYLQPSQFYGRIHASAYPENRYREPNGALLSILYDVRDGWTAKRASTGIYAVTDKRIPLSKIKRVV